MRSLLNPPCFAAKARVFGVMPASGRLDGLPGRLPKVLRVIGSFFALMLIVNLIGLITGEIPRNTRSLLLAVGGLGLGVVAWIDRRRRDVDQ
jgi:hypothetical protein